jgi:tetratricopeptide (TPR) repeat protein
MFKQLLRTLGKPAAPVPAAASASPDPRVAQGLAAHAAAQARYAALLEPAHAETASTATLLEFAQAAYTIERDEECEQALRRILALEPDHALAHYSLALLIANDARLTEAETHLRRVLALAPTDVNVRFTLAMALLGRSQYSEGYRLFRARREGPRFSAPHIEALPAWNGEALAGKTLVLWSDWGGFGDDIAYARFARMIRERLAPRKLIVAARGPMLRLLKAQPYIDEAVGLETEVAADWQCPLIDSVNAVGTDLDSLPNWPSYIEAPAEELRYWGKRLHGEQRLKVGIVWTSTSVPPGETGRVGRADKHLPNAALAALAGLPDVVFVSLQKGANIPAAAQLLPGTPVFDETADLDDFADTAALVRQLDLVVAIDTAVGHLAGALGVPTLLLLKRGRGYFWPLDREDTPWYPSVRMVVQPRLRDWESVMARVRVTIGQRAAGVPWPQCFDQNPSYD